MIRGIVLLSLVAVACSVEESGAGPASGGAGGSGAQGGTGGLLTGGSGGAPLGGAGGIGSASGAGGAGGIGGASGSGGVEAGSDASSDVELDVGSDAPNDADASSDAAGDAGFVTALHGSRVELPCAGVISSSLCNAGTSSKSFPFEGKSGVSYDLTLRIRGVVEQNGYTCVVKTDYFCTGGAPAGAGWSVFSVKVADPPQTYYLNAGAAGILHAWPLDYQATITVKGGALVQLSGDSIDGQQLRNLNSSNVPIVVAGVSPDPAAYDGQFVQIDVVSILPK